MTIVEAMKESKRTGKVFIRNIDIDIDWFGYRYISTWTYNLTADDILADDWVFPNAK